MGRPAEFDRAKALHEAMEVFWRQGYRGAAISDLVTATDLRPGSLYAAFHSKRGLFLEALDIYAEGIREFVHDSLHGPGPPLARIRRFFERLVEESVADPEAKGCLLVNTLLETPPDDAELNKRVSSVFEEIESELAGVLEEARERRELPADKDPATLARVLVTGIYGLRVYNRRHPDRRVLEGIVEGLLSALH